MDTGGGLRGALTMPSPLVGIPSRSTLCFARPVKKARRRLTENRPENRTTGRILDGAERPRVTTSCKGEGSHDPRAARRPRRRALCRPHGAPGRSGLCACMRPRAAPVCRVPATPARPWEVPLAAPVSEGRVHLPRRRASKRSPVQRCSMHAAAPSCRVLRFRSSAPSSRPPASRCPSASWLCPEARLPSSRYSVCVPPGACGSGTATLRADLSTDTHRSRIQS